MTSQLSAQTEKVVPYEYFGAGRVVDLMPQLTKAGYVPAGIAVLVDRRQYAPEEVRANFKTSYFWTGDSEGADEKGGALLTLDSPLLRQLTPESTLVNGALKLNQEQWKELKADKEHSLYLTPQQVEAAQGKGYVLKKGKFVPANKAVAKAWEHLNRGKGLQAYAQMVSEASRNNDVMQLYFDQSQPSTPTLRSFVLLSFDNYSDAGGNPNLNNGNGRLVGVVKNILTVHSDPETASQLERIARGGSKQKAVRCAVRLTDYFLRKTDEDYKIALLKAGQDPILVEFLDEKGNIIE